LKAVLFDLDDTLLDRLASMDLFLVEHHRRFGFETIPLAAYRDRFHALDGHGYVPRDALFTQLVADFGLSADVALLVRDFQRNAWLDCQLFADARDVLCELRARGHPIGIITNGVAESQRVKLETSGVLDCVDVAMIAGDEGISKPDPEIFHRCAQRLGVSSADCIFVGDHPLVDVPGALAAGMTPVWIERHLRWPDDHEGPRPRRITSLAELLTLVS
jgi:putative hydrolase of the HAD superfamily